MRGQNGGKAGTVSVCEKNHSLIYKSPFFPTLPHALADLVALPLLLLAPSPGAVCSVRAMACTVTPAFAHIEPHRTPPEMAAKGVLPWPTFSGRCGLALLHGAHVDQHTATRCKP